MSDGLPSVSVILTSYNRPGMLREAVKSVQRQTSKDWELILCDDNSGPETEAVIIEMASQDPRIRPMLHSTRPEERKLSIRYATMINEALCYARGDLFCYLVDDDLYLPRFIERMKLEFQRDEKLAAAVCSQVRLGSSMNPDDGATFLAHTENVSEPYHVVDHSTVMHRRDAIDRIGAWEDQPITRWMDADAMFWEKLVRLGAFRAVPEVLTAKRIHGENVTEKVLGGRDIV